MFESNPAGNDLIALPEAANDAVFDVRRNGRDLGDADAGAMLQGIEPRGGKRIATARFCDSGAALFRPFRIY